VQQALKKQIISAFEPVYLDVLNNNMVGFANISARDMLDHIFATYGNITAVDLEISFEHMRRAYDPQQPVESLFKQIQDYADYYEAGGVLIGQPHKINVGYANIFATGHFMSACRRWNEKPLAEKTWAQFKAHFSAAHRQHKHMQGEYVNTSGKSGAQIPHLPLGDDSSPLGEIIQYVFNLTRFTRLCVTSHSQPLINAKYKFQVTNYLQTTL
jgi:hypothetical protein